MPKPEPGRQYIIVDENTLSQVALRAYGDAQYWPRIWSANQSNLRSGNPDLIFPGEIIYIPELPERPALEGVLAGKTDEDMTLVLDGREIPTKSMSIFRSMDTASDAWSAEIAWEFGKDPDLDFLTRPFGYTPAKAYIGRELIITGALYAIQPELTDGGSIKKLWGYSRTIDIVDSSLRPPYEQNNVTLRQRAEEVLKGLGIGIVYNVSDDAAFDRVTGREGQKIFAHLNPLAVQRQVVMSSTPKGEFLFDRANVNGAPVDALVEGVAPVRNFKAKFDGRERFNTYKALTRSSFGSDSKVAIDPSVPKSRFFTFTADESRKGDLQKAAEWKRNQTLTKALTIPVPVTGWHDSSGRLWRENTIVNYKAPSINVPNGFDFLIRNVEFEETAGGRTAVLSLIPPQVYSEGDIIEPWA